MGSAYNVEVEEGRVLCVFSFQKGTRPQDSFQSCTWIMFHTSKLPCHPFSPHFSPKVQAFAANFHAAGVGTGPPGPAVAVRRRSSVSGGLPMLKEMTPAEVEQITGRLAEVKRSYNDFGETPVEADMKRDFFKKRGMDFMDFCCEIQL